MIGRQATAGAGADPRLRSVRAFLRFRGRTRSAPVDRYVTAFCIAMFLAVLGKPLSDVVAGLAGTGDPARTGAGAALVALGLAGFLRAARAAGPVVLPGPDASWLLLSPLNRRHLLGRTGRALLTVAVVAGAVLGLGMLAVLGAPDQLVWRLLGALALGISATVGAMALAVLAQASQSWQVWLTAAMVALLAVAVISVSGRLRTVLAIAASAPPQAVAVAVCGASVAAALLVRQAWASLDRIPARDILAASTRAGHVASAAVGVDPGVFTWIAEDNHWRARKLSSRRWPSLPAPLALAWQDWRRLARRPGRLAAMFATAALPAVLAQAGGAPAALGAAVLAGGLAVASASASGARRDNGNPALARLIGVGHRPALAARAALPALLSGAWTAAALAGLTLVSGLTLTGGPTLADGPTLTGVASAVGGAAASGMDFGVGAGAGAWWLFGPLIAPALAAGALRMARRGPVDHSLPVIDTPGGAIPLGPVLWAATGVDLAVLGCLPAAMALMTPPGGLGAFLAAQAVAGVAVLAGYVWRARPGKAE
ncbi:DUF6297 family protein [Nonomuraea basaltis]|uniref:DUF6297 family protein n=1 Tax=Nonomuraea basaltis TaxID=2495887 RepID=UPI00110C5397|nr:DUF6297 family protein [Nonomuraea basaltis]TMS00236.1 hypothetical protein EJK15_03945 [Nonomuraea basaltis]